MPLVHPSELCELGLDAIRSWEDMFGVDYPGYLPYWIAYMPPAKRRQYLIDTKGEYTDFEDSMLRMDYDWHKWEPTIPDHGYIEWPTYD